MKPVKPTSKERVEHVLNAIQLIPIDQDESHYASFSKNTDCQEILKVYPDYYKRVGFNPPWIGYMVERDNKFIGCGGFKGKPKDSKIEIAYAAFKKYEGQGIGTEICRQLVLLSVKTDPNIRITARTLPENNASVRILKRNGFEFIGTVFDDEDGNVWEWEFKGDVLS